MSSRDPIRVFEKYEVIRRLATGGMGDIFLARQIGVAGFNRVVVLKSLRPDVVERDEFFAQESMASPLFDRLRNDARFSRVVGIVGLDATRLAAPAGASRRAE